MDEKTIKYVKILWLPLLIIALMISEPFLGLVERFGLYLTGLEIILFAIYTYILVKSGILLKPRTTYNPNTKGRRKQKNK
ncbi:hypothetical protein CUJ83_05000 [Methanocella sp. CWC-04]|uniref:Uncharacterized protein n=1 Tax=Methanooceanicella nereidis TaxID=2052831 RepID=A0AAP2RE32_9EURY|nr:hypothetical protein [Methanocella sp. CWC-04]MCD1294355.1 hypothetical protein [Methanocella sp. CWC-04]